MSKHAYSELRRSIKSEKISLPKTLLERSTIKIFAYTAFPHLLILLSLYVSSITNLSVWWVPFYLVTFLAAQRCFQTLVHDSSHRFFSRNNKFNDFFANYLVAGWIGSTVGAYRSVHHRHHVFNGSKEDPEHIDFNLIREKGGLLFYILRYALCLEALRLVKKYYFPTRDYDSQLNSQKAQNVNKPNPLIGKIHIVVTQLILLALFTSVASPVLYILWLYVAVSWTPLLSGLRFLVEHPGESDLTVSTLSNPLEALFFAPFNFNYHFEHHVWPSLPPYRLKEAHEFLQISGYYKRHAELINRSFISSLREQS